MSLIHFERAGTAAQVGTLAYSPDLTWKVVLEKAQSLVQTDLTYGVRLFRGHGGEECHRNDGLVTECPEEPIVIWPLTDTELPSLRARKEKWPDLLIEACRRNDENRVRALLALGVNVLHDYPGYTMPALLSMVQAENHRMVEVLLECGAKIDFTSQGVQTPLFIAVKKRNYGIAKLLVERGANVNIPDMHEQTPLMCCAIHGDFDTARLLLQHGARTDLRDRFGRTADVFARKHGHWHLRALIQMYETPKTGTDL